MNNIDAEIYKYTTTFYSVSPDNTGLILALIGLFVSLCASIFYLFNGWRYAFHIAYIGIVILIAGILWTAGVH